MARTSHRPRRTSPFNLPSAFDLFTPSKEIVLKNVWIFGPLYAVPLIFWIHSWIWSPLPNQHVQWWHHSGGFSSGWPGGPLPTYGTFALVGFSILWLVLILIFGTIAQIMAQAAQLDGAEDRRLDFAILWRVVKEQGWMLFGLYIVVGLLVGLPLTVWVLMLVAFRFWGLLFFPLGFISLIVIQRYFLAPYVMIDKKLGIRESMDRSAELSKLNTGSVWGIIGVMFLIGLINIVPIIGGLGSFIFGSLYSVAPALRYLQLKDLKQLA